VPQSESIKLDSDEERRVVADAVPMVRDAIEQQLSETGAIRHVQAVVSRALDELAGGKELVAIEPQLSAEDAARVLGLSRTFVVRLCEQGKLPCSFAGSHRRIPAEAVREMLAERERRSKLLDAISDEERTLGVS
jgi:excisionase family DNA binding protein